MSSQFPKAHGARLLIIARVTTGPTCLVPHPVFGLEGEAAGHDIERVTILAPVIGNEGEFLKAGSAIPEISGVIAVANTLSLSPSNLALFIRNIPYLTSMRFCNRARPSPSCIPLQ